jgi:hypothetical protein
MHRQIRSAKVQIMKSTEPTCVLVGFGAPKYFSQRQIKLELQQLFFFISYYTHNIYDLYYCDYVYPLIVNL